MKFDKTNSYESLTVPGELGSSSLACSAADVEMAFVPPVDMAGGIGAGARGIGGTVGGEATGAGTMGTSMNPPGASSWLKSTPSPPMRSCKASLCVL